MLGFGYLTITNLKKDFNTSKKKINFKKTTPTQS